MVFFPYSVLVGMAASYRTRGYSWFNECIPSETMAFWPRKTLAKFCKCSKCQTSHIDLHGQFGLPLLDLSLCLPCHCRSRCKQDAQLSYDLHPDSRNDWPSALSCPKSNRDLCELFNFHMNCFEELDEVLSSKMLKEGTLCCHRILVDVMLSYIPLPSNFLVRRESKNFLIWDSRPKSTSLAQAGKMHLRGLVFGDHCAVGENAVRDLADLKRLENAQIDKFSNGLLFLEQRPKVPNYQSITTWLLTASIYGLLLGLLWQDTTSYHATCNLIVATTCLKTDTTPTTCS